VLVGNMDTGERVDFGSRLSTVTTAWAEAETFSEETRDLVLQHRDQVMSGFPLGLDTEHLIAELLVSIDEELPLPISSADTMDPAVALELAAEQAPFLRDELLVLLDLFLRVGAAVGAGGTAAGAMATLLTRLARMNELRAQRTVVDVARGLNLFTQAQAGSCPDYLAGQVWSDYGGDTTTLSALVTAIRQEVQLNDAPLAVPDDEEVTFPEGRQLYRRHRQRERSSGAVRQKKANALHANGRLTCEVCGFEFGAIYHELGDGYIECHHNIPVSEYAAESRTRLEDLSLVCANCHRVLHRRRPWLTAGELRDYLAGVAST
jgi:5-methylcytosine-specific restriction protein A